MGEGKAVVGIGLIGAGNWGRNLVRNFAMLPQAELKYIWRFKPGDSPNHGRAISTDRRDG